MASKEKVALYDAFMKEKEAKDLKKERYAKLLSDENNVVYVNGARVDKKDAKKLLLEGKTD